MKSFIKLILILFITSSFQANFPQDNIEISHNAEQNFVKIEIGQEMIDPLNIFLFDKKGNQLKYKYWENGRNREIKINMDGFELSYWVVEVASEGKTIAKKNFKLKS